MFKWLRSIFVCKCKKEGQSGETVQDNAVDTESVEPNTTEETNEASSENSDELNS